MPEIAEAHTMADELSIFIGHQILDVQIYSNNSNKFNNIQLAYKQTVVNVFAIGKRVIIQLNNGYLLTTLSMTGKWLFQGPHLDSCFSYIKLKIAYGKNVGRLNRIKGHIYFIDTRTWGNVEYLTDEEFNCTISKIGPDPLNGELTREYFVSAITKESIGKRPVCDFLNDQAIIGGIGNWIRSQIMYEAGVFPFKPISQLAPEEIDKLYNSVISVCKRAYGCCGYSIDDKVGNYVSPTGKSGYFAVSVYMKSVCPNGHLVQQHKRTKGAQTVHYCPIEQI